jgi:hypothetical protein
LTGACPSGLLRTVDVRSLVLLPLALAAFVASGCASKCGANCPTPFVYVGAPAGTNMDLMNIQALSWTGPACPTTERPNCAGDGVSTICTHVLIVGQGPGECALTITFGDRPAEVVHAQFGPPITQGCCHGFSVVGDTVFTIPSSADAGIYGAGGNMDAVTILTDAGDGGAAPADAHDAADAD